MTLTQINFPDMLIVLFTTVDFLLPLIVRSVGAFDVAAIFRLLRMFRAIRALRALRVLRTIRYNHSVSWKMKCTDHLFTVHNSKEVIVEG